MTNKLTFTSKEKTKYLVQVANGVNLLSIGYTELFIFMFSDLIAEFINFSKNKTQ